MRLYPSTAKLVAIGVACGNIIFIENARVPQECDFEGRPSTPSSPIMGIRSSGNLSAASGQCHLVFTGLNRTGLDLRGLTVTVHFGVDSVHKVGKIAGPIQASGLRSY